MCTIHSFIAKNFTIRATNFSYFTTNPRKKSKIDKNSVIERVKSRQRSKVIKCQQPKQQAQNIFIKIKRNKKPRFIFIIIRSFFGYQTESLFFSTFFSGT